MDATADRVLRYLRDLLTELETESTDNMRGYELHEQAGQIQLLRGLLVEFSDLDGDQ